MTFSVSCWHQEMVKSDQERVNPRLPSITVWALPFSTWHTQALTVPQACSRYAPKSVLWTRSGQLPRCV